MLHKISVGGREMGDNSFLRNFRARILFQMGNVAVDDTTHLRSAEHEILVSPGEKLNF